MGTNQFVAGPPVTGDRFFGRVDELDFISSNLGAGSSSLFVGQRRVGKSSLLHQVDFLFRNHKLAGDLSNPIPVYLDGAVTSTTQFPRYLAREVVVAARNSAPTQPASIAKFLQRLQPKQGISVTETIELLARLRQEGPALVILLDEADAAIAGSEGEAAILLRSLISQGHVLSVCTSFLRPDEVEVYAAGASPWFNVFSIRSLGPLKLQEALELLRENSRDSGREFSSGECKFLLDVLGKNPYFLQMAGSRLFRDHSFADLKSRERPQALRNAIRTLPNDLQFHLSYVFEHLAPADFAVLRKICLGKESTDNSALKRLEWLGLIEGEENGWEVSSGLLREYVKARPHLASQDKVGLSPNVLAKLRSAAWEALGIAVEKAISAATKSFL